MEYLTGAVLALAVGVSATLLGLDRDRAFYPTVMVVIASYYALFAVMGGSAHALVIESAVMTAFLAASIFGFKGSLWLVVAALLTHGVFDFIHGQDRSESRIGAMCAIAGSVLLFVGTYLHPMEADPNDATAAFAEYAADHLWLVSHLTQLLGVALMVAALLFLSQQLESVSGTGWSRVAAGGAIASLAVGAALQAVDGTALKVMVDAWAAASAAQKKVAFYGAFAVRQLEIGLASMLSLSFGLTMTVYGVALPVDRSYPKWMGGLAIVGGVPTTAAGVVMAYTGFSGLAMAINMPASFALLVWMLGLGVFMWRRGGGPPDETAL